MKTRMFILLSLCTVVVIIALGDEMMGSALRSISVADSSAGVWLQQKALTFVRAIVCGALLLGTTCVALIICGILSRGGRTE